jgi:sugar phosphate isomerase/epimerase
MPLVLAAGSMLDVAAPDLVAAAAAAGFDSVGLRRSGEHGSDGAGVLAATARTGCAVHDIEVHRITTPPADPGRLLDDAAALGAAAVLVVSDLADRGATVDAVGRLVAAAAERALTVGLEYMAWTDPSAPLDAIDVADATGCRLVVDVLHHVRVGAGPAELAAIVAAGHLGWVQLCDAPLDAPDDLVHEARHDRLPPGAGMLPLRALLDVVPVGTPISVEVQRDALRAVAPSDRARLLHDATRAVLVDAGHRSSTG